MQKFLQVSLTGAADRITTTRTPCLEIIVQNNSTHAIRVGDSTVTATTGQAVPASNAAPGPFILGPFAGGQPLELSLLYIIGTASDKVDVCYVTA